MAVTRRKRTPLSTVRLSSRSVAAIKDGDVIAINLPGSVKARSRGRSKAKFTVEISTEPILHDFGALRLNGEPPERIKEILQSRIASVTEKVSDATLQRRERYVREFAADGNAAMKRFGAARTKAGLLRKGSKLGDTPPVSNRLYKLNHSGRLAEGLAVRHNPKADSFTINTAANRFNLELFGNPAQFSKFISDFERLIDPRSIIRDKRVIQAVKDAVDDAMIRQLNRNAALAQRMRAARASLFRQVGRGLLGAVFP